MFCEKCGEKVEDTWNNCPVCGKEVNIPHMFFPNFKGKKEKYAILL